MANSASNGRVQGEEELVARAAWLHFVGGLTQAEVAARLGLSPTRAHRLIAKAQNSGLVQIAVKATAASCLELENKLAEAYGLGLCRVAMDLPEAECIPLRSLGAAGGEWLGQVLAQGSHKAIGISHGRTIAAMVENLWQRPATDAVFVSLLGGLTRSLAANPYDVIHRLAQKTGAESYLMPVPLFANSAEDREIMVAQSMLTEAFSRMGSVTLAIVGIGDVASTLGASLTGEDHAGHIERLHRCGAVAEILGQFIDAEGNKISTPLDGRTMALDLEDLRGRDVVAIAGGAEKLDPIRAALKSGLLTGLIVDEATARVLVDGLEGKDAVAAE